MYIYIDWVLIIRLGSNNPRWASDNTDLLWNSNMSKTVKVNVVFTRCFLKSIWYLGWQTLYFLFASYRYLKFVELLESQKSSFSFFPVLKELNTKYCFEYKRVFFKIKKCLHFILNIWRALYILSWDYQQISLPSYIRQI